MNSETLSQLANDLVHLAQAAGEEILRIYRDPQQMDISTKSDSSPVTAADLAAHKVLAAGLTKLTPGIPLLSEEGQLPSFEQRQQWSEYWLIDPLDGTKEFINRNDEFTVNIALIKDGAPILGVVYVPPLEISYVGVQGVGAWKLANGEKRDIKVRSVNSRLENQSSIDVVASRRHGNEEVDIMLSTIREQLGTEVATKNMGSSLKLCLVAEGEADLYPRLAPTCEWDTAAAQAVVEAAGGIVVNEQFEILRYNQKDELLNPFFYVLGDKNYHWQKVLK